MKKRSKNRPKEMAIECMFEKINKIINHCVNECKESSIFTLLHFEMAESSTTSKNYAKKNKVLYNVVNLLSTETSSKK